MYAKMVMEYELRERTGNPDARIDEDVVTDGPILISTIEVKGADVMSQLRDKIVKALEKRQLVNKD